MNDSPVTKVESVSPRITTRQQFHLILKELRETLRDRRTVTTLLAMPLLVYPLLGLGFRALAAQQEMSDSAEYRIALSSDEDAEWLSHAVREGTRLLQRDAATDDPPEGSPEEDNSPRDVRYQVYDTTQDGELEAIVASGVADIAIEIGFASPDDPTDVPQVEIAILQAVGSPLSRDVADYVERRLDAVRTEAIRRWARARDAKFRLPLEEARRLVTAQEGPSAVLGIFPLILLLMTVTGGVYPAIDLTAGERERDTLEILMAMPIPRFRLLIAKYAAVVTVTVLTGGMNLVAMLATVYTLQLEQALFGSAGITFGLGFRLVIMLFALALFYSSLLLLLTSSARSFKEAQAYLIPLLLISIAPGLVILLPGWRLNLLTAMLPFVNMLLLARELFEGTASLLPMLLATGATLVYAALALALATQVFGTNAVAVGSSGRWSDLTRRPQVATETVESTTALTSLLVLFPLYFAASGAVGRLGAMSMTARLVTSALLTGGLFAGLPWVVLLRQRVRFKTGIRFQAVPVTHLVGAVLMGLSVWPWIFEIVIWMHTFGLQAFDASKVQGVEELLAGWRDVPLPLLLFALAIMPGVCEEIFFRGFLFAGVRNRYSVPTSIVLTAVAFGIFHVILSGGLAPERLIPSTLIGLVLGWVAWKTGSILPSMTMHVLHNGTLLTLAWLRDDVSMWGLGVSDAEHLPLGWLVGSLVVLGAGVTLIQRTTARAKRRAEVIPETT